MNPQTRFSRRSYSLESSATSMYKHRPLATASSDPPSPSASDDESSSSLDFPHSTNSYPPSSLRRTRRSSVSIYSRVAHLARLARTYSLSTACAAFLLFIVLVHFLRSSSAPTHQSPDSLPSLTFPNGSRYAHSIPTSSLSFNSNPWPSRPEIAQKYLLPSHLRPRKTPLEIFDLPEAYGNATDGVWVEKRRGWRGAGLNRGEGYDEKTGRVSKVPREVLYTGKGDGWTPRALGGAKEGELPRVQHSSFSSGRDPRSEEEREQDEARREWVKRAFEHVWGEYKEHAWAYDELKPLSGGRTTPFNGWGATVFDSLDTLLLMNLTSDYLLARSHIARVDFSYTTSRNPSYYQSPVASALPPLTAFTDSDETNPLSEHLASPAGVATFETVIRYLGSLISAYDLSHDPLMLRRAVDLGDWLLPSMATESGLLVPTYRLGAHSDGGPVGTVCLAEVGSVALEFIRLSQLTGDMAYAEAAQRSLDYLDAWPSSSDRIPHLFPTQLNTDIPSSLPGVYTFGGQADSYYEYLIKLYQLLGGSSQTNGEEQKKGREDSATQYGRMYRDAIDSAQKHLIRAINVVPGLEGAVTIGDVHYKVELNGKTQSWYSMRLDHLTCFAGGMLGLGSRLLNRSKDLETAKQFTKACIWAYDSTVTGLAPETMELWSETNKYRFEVVELDDGTLAQTTRGDPAGVYSSRNHHIQRPETVESLWYMYRLTGDRSYQDKGWRMFTSWVATTVSAGGFSHVHDVTSLTPRLEDDGIESFVYGETLKYYYLLFSPPDFMSLDDWVFSTEAHPLRLRQPSTSSSTSSSPPFWSANLPPLSDLPRSVSEAEYGMGSRVQKWARMVQAAGMRGWRWHAQ